MEVSGKRFLDFNGEVITTAANGQTGTLLLDPDDIIIKDGSSASDDGQISGDHVVLFADGSGTFNISESALEALNATNNIVLEANNTITIQNLSDNELNLQTTSNNSVRFQTTSGAITFNDTNDLVRTNGGAITFKAGGSLTLGKLNSNGGNIDLTSTGGSVSALKDINSGGGTIGINGFSGVFVGPIQSKGGAVSLSATSTNLSGSSMHLTGNVLTGGGNYSASAASGKYQQDPNIFVATAGGNASVTANEIDLLSGFTSSGGDTFGVPISISTDTFSFINGPSSGTITIKPFSSNRSICIATTGCNIVLTQNEIISLRAKKLTVGNNSSGNINFGDVDLGHKETEFISGDDIFGIGANIVFHENISLTAKENINFVSGSSFEAHVSGFNSSFTAVADSDQTDGGGFNLSSNSFIRTEGGNVNITGNAISPAGNNPDNIITNGGSYNRTIRSTTVSAAEANESPLAEFIEEVLEGEIPFSALRRLNPRFADVRSGAVVDRIFEIFADKSDEEIEKIIEDEEQAKQVSVLADFLDNGGAGKPGC